MIDKEILHYIQMYGNDISINSELLAKVFDMPEREARRAIKRLRYDYCILNFQNGDGYFCPDEDTEEGQDQISAWIEQETSRAIANFAHIKGARKASANLSQIDWNEVFINA